MNETLTDDIAALLSEVITELDNLDSSANVVLQRCVAMRDRLDGMDEPTELEGQANV